MWHVGDQGEEGQPEELLVNGEALQHDVDGVNQDFGDDRVQDGCPQQDHGALGAAPVWRVVAPVAPCVGGRGTRGRGVFLDVGEVAGAAGGVRPRRRCAGAVAGLLLGVSVTGSNCGCRRGDLGNLARQHVSVGLAEAGNLDRRAQRLLLLLLLLLLVSTNTLGRHHVRSAVQSVGTSSGILAGRGARPGGVRQADLLEGLAQDALVQMRVAYVGAGGFGGGRLMRGSKSARRVHRLLVPLLFHLGVPDDGGVGAQGKPETDEVGEEEHKGGEITVGPHGLEVEAVVEGGRLRKVAPAAVSRAAVAAVEAAVGVVFAVHAVELVRAVDLVKQRGAEGADDGEEQHGGRHAGRLGVEALRLSLQGAEAHGDARQEEDAGEYAPHDAPLDELALALAQRDAVEENLDDGGEEGIDGGAQAHGRLGGDGCHGLADEVGQRDDGEQARDEQEGGRRDEHLQAQDAIQDEPVGDDEDDDDHEVDEEDDGRVRGVVDARVADVGLERQGEGVTPEVVEQQHGHLAHGDPEDEEPADAGHDDEGGRDEAVEEDEEDDAANVPLSAAKEPPLHPRVQVGRLSAAPSPQQALRLAGLRVQAPPGAADDGAVPVPVGPKEQPAVLEVAVLPLLVRLVLLQADELAEGVEEVTRQTPQDPAVLPPAGRGGEQEADDGAKGRQAGYPPPEEQRPGQVEEEQPVAHPAAGRRVDVGLGKLLDGPVLLVQRGLPHSDAERVRLVDGLLPVLEGEAFGFADFAVGIAVDVLVQRQLLLLAAVLLFGRAGLVVSFGFLFVFGAAV
ncbi:hypothetical protein Trco_004479 [Trichoderma cornu-damae]|uniref:Uncharacterized protein n=1 Tax=Trichoderma cornu-damae TaxID=654480 RepID=A0A9P8TU73_9HYPO|nr:hypothetical protein Trco_004479 [Trichoderma cornu-damae]